jgi:tetratricopeptide (TPR) repeat protein
VKNIGGGATDLKDHVFGGKKALDAIRTYFPNKPLKYLLHSHWHPHSISSVRPFLENGVTLISTRTNFSKMSVFIDSATIARYQKQITFVDNDSLVIKDKFNSIVAYKFLKHEYKSTPAEEYLYFYFPKYYALHSGCMYNKWTGPPVDGREMYTEREQDLNKFITKKKIRVDKLVRISGDRQAPSAMMDAKDFKSIAESGITANEINEKYFALPTLTLILKQDSVAENVIKSNIPLSLINGNVYTCLREKDFERALAFAKLQVMITPTDPNAWDTLGEVNFIIGRKDLAINYYNQSVKIDPTFSAGGTAVWQNNLQEYQSVWDKR